MTKQSMPQDRSLIQSLAGPEGDVLREALEQMVWTIMEAEVSAIVGAEPFERSDSRTTQRNGHRDRARDTRLSRILLRIPKLRQGTYFPSFLEPRRRAERALVAVVQEAYVSGASTRAVDDLVKALGDDVTIDKSTVSRFRGRSIATSSGPGSRTTKAARSRPRATRAGRRT
jgi:transposase-like protein